MASVNLQQTQPCCSSTTRKSKNERRSKENHSYGRAGRRMPWRARNTSRKTRSDSSLFLYSSTKSPRLGTKSPRLGSKLCTKAAAGSVVLTDADMRLENYVRVEEGTAKDDSSRERPSVKEGYFTFRQLYQCRYVEAKPIIAEGNKDKPESVPVAVLIHGFGGNCEHWRKNMLGVS